MSTDRRGRLAALIAVPLAAMPMACGSDDPDPAPAPTAAAAAQHAPADGPRYFITGGDVQAAVRDVAEPEAAAVALRFWQAMQTGNYPVGFALVAPAASARMTYYGFVRSFSRSGAMFRRRPTVESVTPKPGGRVEVRVGVPEDQSTSPSDRPVVFALQREGQQWFLASAPGRQVSRTLLSRRRPSQAVVPLLVTGRYIAAQVDGKSKSDADAAAAMFRFWRAVQDANFDRAYRMLGRELRASTSKAVFVRDLARSQGQFAYKPRLRAVDRQGDLTVISLLLQRGKTPNLSEDPPSVMNMQLEDGRWVVATDPQNALMVPTGADAGQ